jgi:hypothetical protein
MRPHRCASYSTQLTEFMHSTYNIAHRNRLSRFIVHLGGVSSLQSLRTAPSRTSFWVQTLSTCTHCWKQMATQSSCEASHCSWLISPSAANARIGSSITCTHGEAQSVRYAYHIANEAPMKGG